MQMTRQNRRRRKQWKSVPLLQSKIWSSIASDANVRDEWIKRNAGAGDDVQNNTSWACSLFSMHLQCEFFISFHCTLI
jgi:hypothetical protein